MRQTFKRVESHQVERLSGSDLAVWSEAGVGADKVHAGPPVQRVKVVVGWNLKITQKLGEDQIKCRHYSFTCDESQSWSFWFQIEPACPAKRAIPSYFIMPYGISGLADCLLKKEVGRNWYQSIHFDKLSCRQESFSGSNWTPLREEHKRFQRP